MLVGDTMRFVARSGYLSDTLAWSESGSAVAITDSGAVDGFIAAVGFQGRLIEAMAAGTASVAVASRMWHATRSAKVNVADSAAMASLKILAHSETQIHRSERGALETRTTDSTGAAFNVRPAWTFSDSSVLRVQGGTNAPWLVFDAIATGRVTVTASFRGLRDSVVIIVVP